MSLLKSFLKTPSLVFSGLGHFYMHFACAMFFTIVLALETEWNMAFYQLNELWTLGAALVGLAAIPAGRLGDKWSARGMMAIFFIGLGLSVIACGFADGANIIIIALAAVGLFSAIYHPIGIPWLIANSRNDTGKILALNGVFGGFGPAAAALVTGFIIDILGWRWAFYLPGILITFTGILMLFYIKSGRIPASGLAKNDAPKQKTGDSVRVFAILIFAMTISGLIYHSTQAILPKFFTINLSDYVDGSVKRAGILVSIVYFISALTQILGGYFADKYSLKYVYVIGWFFQIIFLAILANITGYSVFIFVLFVASISTGILPAENMLIYKYSPANHKGLAFGLKFVLSFGVAPLSLHLISFIQQQTGKFYWLFMALAITAAVIAIITILLPKENKDKVVI